MTAARDIITDALFACGSHGRGDSLSAYDGQLGLRVLQRMLDSWSNDNLTIPYTATAQKALAAGTAAYPVSGFSIATMPVTIQNVWVDEAVDSPLEPITEEQYNVIPDKTIRGVPLLYFVKRAASGDTFYLYPTPDSAYTLYVNGRYQLAAGLTLDAGIVLPAGYEKAIVSNLAVELCDYYGIDPRPSLVQQAANARSALVATNFVPGFLDTGLPMRHSTYRIERGS